MPAFVRAKRSNSNLWTGAGGGAGTEGRSPVLPSSPSFASSIAPNGGLASPSSAGGHYPPSSLSAKAAAGRELLTPFRRRPLRSFSYAAGIFVSLWLLVTFFGGFDPALDLGPHIDPLTFQVFPAGDPRKRGNAPISQKTHAQLYENWNVAPKELLDNTPPSQRKCDKDGPLLFIGLFSTEQGVGRRQIIRTIFKPDLNPVGHTIAFKFIVAKPSDDDWRYELEKENELYDDIAILENVSVDNINEGKSVEYIRWLANELPDPKPQFVMKMDDDTFLVMPNVIRNLASLDCNKAIYWGTTQGSAAHLFGRYMRGLCYGLSWPLASWIGTANTSQEFAIGVEDAKIGRIISFLDPVTEPVEWVDHGWKMGDWDQLKVDATIVGYHWLKLDHWVPMVRRKALGAWKEAGRPYRWDWDRAGEGALGTHPS